MKAVGDAPGEGVLVMKELENLEMGSDVFHMKAVGEVLETVLTMLVTVVEDIKCSDIADVIVELNLLSASNAL
nr:hypothetical protein CFP56_31901 [Quercus suber]